MADDRQGSRHVLGEHGNALRCNWRRCPRFDRPLSGDEIRTASVADGLVAEGEARPQSAKNERSRTAGQSSRKATKAASERPAWSPTAQNRAKFSTWRSANLIPLGCIKRRSDADTYSANLEPFGHAVARGSARAHGSKGGGGRMFAVTMQTGGWR